MSESIRSKTSTGTEVTLTGVEEHGYARVRVEFVHPAVGPVHFVSHTYATVEGHGGIVGRVYVPKTRKEQRCCVTVPRADFDSAMTAARSIGERELEALKSGAAPIQVHYHDGEYLSGYSVGGRAGKLLIEMGLAKEVSGWGTHVESRVVEALGESFTYAQATEFARPELEARAQKKAQRADAREAKFAEARQTGKPVVLTHGMDECDGSVDDCTWDEITVLAMPDGTTKTSRIHTH